jgi:hypothetical protein
LNGGKGVLKLLLILKTTKTNVSQDRAVGLHYEAYNGSVTAFGLVVRVLGYRTEMYCGGLVVRVPGYKTEMYCVSCEVRTEFIYVM